MAITFGDIGAKAEGQATIAIPYPASVGAGDLLLVGRCLWRPSTITATDETGWTPAGDLFGGTGTSTDDHTTRIRGDWREAAGGETGTVTFDTSATDGSTSDAAIGVMARYVKGAGTWDVAAETGDDATHDNTRTVTLGTALTVAVGDWLVALVGVDRDPALTITASSFSGTATFGTIAERASGIGSALGRDGNIAWFDVEVTGAGTCTGFSMTTDVVLQCGPVSVVRLREIPGGAAYDETPADSEGISDASTVTQAADRAAADPVGIADAIGATRDIATTLEDSVGLADSVQSGAGATRTAADPVGITDTDSPLRLDIGETLDDELGLTDSVTATLGGAGDATATPVDTVPTSDTAAAALDIVRAPADPVGLADAAGAVATLVRATADQLALTDSVAVVLTRTVTVADSVTAADLASTFLGAIATPLERTAPVAAETRVSAVAAESRTTAVEASS